MKNNVLHLLKEYVLDFIYIISVVFASFLWFSIFASAFGNFLCYNLSTCYSILLFLIGTIISLKLLILSENKNRKEVILFILGVIFNFMFILAAFFYDSSSIALDIGNNAQSIDYKNVIEAAIILNGAIWIDTFILLKNVIQVIKLFFKKHIYNTVKSNSQIHLSHIKKQKTIGEIDLFEYWLDKEDSSNLILKALIDKSYKVIYREMNKCEMEDFSANFEMATFGDSILKMGLMKILNEKGIKKPTEVKKKYESNEALVKYIAPHYNILDKIKYNKDKIMINNYDYDSNYIYYKNGKKKGNRCKFIATCVEALLAAIYLETNDMDVILKIINRWVEIIDFEISKIEVK